MYKIYPKTLFIGQKINYLPTCQSTNDVAADLIARDEAEEGLLVITDRQTAGRGQRGNQWQAEPGQNLTLSLVLRPTFLTAAEQFWLNMAVSVGIYDALAPLVGDALRIKWPNDVFAGDQKLGGILIENTLQGYHIAYSVIGIGLNVNQTQFTYSGATSLLALQPIFGGYELPPLLGRLCESLEQRYLQLRAGVQGAATQRELLKAAYLQQLYRYGEEHSFAAGNDKFRGTIIGIDAGGRLAIQTDRGLRFFAFKEVTFMH